MNKNKYLKYGLIILGTLALITLIFFFIKKPNKNLKCVIDRDLVDGIHLNENIKVSLTDGKIKHINLLKKVTLSGDYLKYDTYKEIIQMHLENGYKYLNDKNYKITSSNDTYVVDANIKESGIILNNLTIIQSDKDNKYDLKINTENNFDNAQNYLKINDKFTKSRLKKYMEESGYKCN